MFFSGLWKCLGKTPPTCVFQSCRWRRPGDFGSDSLFLSLQFSPCPLKCSSMLASVLEKDAGYTPPTCICQSFVCRQPCWFAFWLASLAFEFSLQFSPCPLRSASIFPSALWKPWGKQPPTCVFHGFVCNRWLCAVSFTCRVACIAAACAALLLSACQQERQ